MKKIESLATFFVEKSLEIKPGDRVFVKYKNGILTPLVEEVIKKIFQAGGVPYVKMEDLEIKNILSEKYGKEGARILAEQRKFEIENFDASISIGYQVELSHKTPNPEFKKEYARLMKEMGLIGKGPKRWLLFNYPSRLCAERAMQEYESYEDTYLDAVLYDYQSLKRDCEKLVELLNKTKEITIIAPGTNLTFRKDDIPSVLLAGEHNLPDGELYTAPIKSMVNGYITFNVPTIRDFHKFENIKLFFKNGKVIDFEVDGDRNAFESFLDMDDGARFIGEFAFGLNQNLFHPVIDTLCDEKITGSIHLALGNCYTNAYNGNRSALHWDLIKILRKDYGGGEVYFDGKLIQKDGLFLAQDLQQLNIQNKRDENQCLI